MTLSSLCSCVPKAYTGELTINEIMAKNTSFLSDANGNFPDYVELKNTGDVPVRLSDWFISDEELDPAKYNLPDVTLEAGGYILVFCDGEGYYNAENGEIHANFGISSSGEEIFLLSKSGKRSSVKIGESYSNISYGVVEEDETATEYMWFASPSPNKKNTGKCSLNAQDVLTKTESALLITEYSNANSYTLLNESGVYSGFVTVKNISDADEDISGYCLSDKEGKTEKWHFPAGTLLKANESITVWCSGKDEVTQNEIHTNFKLNSKDSELILSLAGTVCQKIDLSPLYEGLSVKINELDLSKTYRRLSSSVCYDTPEEAVTVASIGVCINEVSAVKGNGANEDYDWIELYNATEEDVDLSGYTLSDDNDIRNVFTFKNTVIKAKEYLLVYCSGINPETTKKNSLYADFKINTSGDTIYLTNTEGVTVDMIESGKLRSSVTCGRRVNGSGERVFFKTATPGKKNAEETFSSYAQNPVLSSAGGFVKKGTEITLLVAEEDTVYRYTLDGSNPTSSSPKFTSVTVNKNTVLRVKAFNDSKISSDVVTATFLTENENETELPVVCLSSNPDGLFSEKNGIFAFGYSYSSSFPYSGANFWQDWEREANFEYYVGGQKVIDALAGIKIFGQYSRAYDQKSIAVYFRGDYGTSDVTYPFFEDSDHLTHSALVLRAGGQDQGMTRIRDAFCSQVVKGSVSLVYQEWTPIVVYINGEYYGLYGLREKINAEWLDRYGNVDGDNLDLIKGNRTAKAGDNKAWMELRDYVKSHDLSKKEYYDYVCSQVDIDNFIDYLIVEIFFCNGDTGNVKFYRERSDDGKWRWIMFDMDMSLRNEALWNSYNAFEKLINDSGHGAGNNFYTHLQWGLMKNKDFKDKFSSRFAELLNTVFMPENMKSVLDEMAAKIDNEMADHCERWGKPATYKDYKTELDNLYRIIEGRRDHVKKQLIEFMDLSDSQVAKLFPNG